MDKKTKKEIDKEVKEIRKTTLMANKRIQKLVGLSNEEEESDEENEEIEDYLNDANEEEVSAILQKAEQEMKEEEEEKKREKKEKEEYDEKMMKELKEEIERISDDEKKKKKKKKTKKKKEEDDSDEEEEEDSYKEYEEYKKWKKMRKLQKEKKKEKNKNKNSNNDIDINKEENNEKKEEMEDKKKKNENEKEETTKDIINPNDNEENDNNDMKEEKENEFDFNMNNINNDININKQEEKDDNINNQQNNDINNDSNNINNNNDIQSNNNKGTVIPKNVYAQVSNNDKKVITELLRTGNAKYQEGEIFFSMGKYSEALKCYYAAKNLYMSIKKLIQTKKNVYPKEFQMIITSKINDKLKLVHQSAKNCSNANKQKIIGHLMSKNAGINNQNNININNTMNNNINNNIANNNINNVNNNQNKNDNITYNINNANNKNKANQNMNNKDLSIDNQKEKIDNKNVNNYNYDFNALNDNNSNNKNNNNPSPKLRNQNQNDQNKQKSLHDKEEDAMDQKILSEIMTKNPGVKFSDIIGMNDMKQTLYEIIVVPTIRPDLFTGIRTPQRGILLFGPPGTGKTMIAKAIASECGSTFFNISASSLTSKWVGESEKTVKSLFKIAYQKVPSIIFIDEIDSILSKRSESENEATKRLKTEFLIQFDGLGSNTNARLLVIAATNRPMDLDEALLRRLPKRVYCGPLDEEGRFEFIKKVINRVETDLSDEDIKEIAKMTNDYSNSDLMELCREAAYKPVRELTNEEIMKLDKFRPINKKDLLDAVNKIRGTLSKKVKDELNKWNEQFGGV